jgi:hypothetical protein
MRCGEPPYRIVPLVRRRKIIIYKIIYKYFRRRHESSPESLRTIGPSWPSTGCTLFPSSSSLPLTAPPDQRLQDRTDQSINLCHSEVAASLDSCFLAAKNNRTLAAFRTCETLQFVAVLRIHDILIRIRIFVSIPLTYGSGSGSC